MVETQPSDAELFARMARGDETAFTELYLRRQAGVYRFALQMSGSPAVAEDVLQEVFLAVIRGRARYEAKRGSGAAFLLGIARNLVLRALARERSHGGELPDQAAPGDLAEDVVRTRMVARLRSAVLILPVHYREVIVLCELQELDYTEAAAALGCAVGTVRSRLHRARQLLAERLGARSVPAGLVERSAI